MGCCRTLSHDWNASGCSHKEADYFQEGWQVLLVGSYRKWLGELSRKGEAQVECCVSSFSHHCDEIVGKNRLRAEEFILACSLRGYSPSWWGGIAARGLAAVVVGACGLACSHFGYQPGNTERDLDWKWAKL